MNIDEIEEEFGSRLNALLLDMRNLEEILLEYERLEAETIARLHEAGAADLIIHVQREVAACRLATAKRKGVDIRTAVELFDRTKDLGYQSSEKRLVAAAIFARICLQNGLGSLAVQDLESALDEAATSNADYSPMRKLLDELRASSG